VRVLQQLLVVLGMTVLGAVVCGPGLAMLAAFTILQPRAGEDPSLGWGAAIVYVGIILGGGVVGAFGGLTMGCRRLARSAEQIWSAPVYAGVILGTLLGGVAGMNPGVLSTIVPGLNGRWVSWVAAGVVTATGGTLGGMLVTVGEKLIRRRAGPKNRIRTTLRNEAGSRERLVSGNDTL
jgi:hypothetical protein